MTKDFVRDYLRKAGYSGGSSAEISQLQSIKDKLDQLTKQLESANANPPSQTSGNADDFSRQTSPQHNTSTNI